MRIQSPLPSPGLHGSIAGDRATVAAELDTLAETVARFQQGRVPEAAFLEYRLRHGIYGQRQDGVHMLRSKLPLGLIGADQLDAFADLTEAYASGVAHLTTRQDIQVHFVPLAQTPALLRVLAAAEMTSREACGNVVRNVCASPLAGVAPGEAFDVTAHGMALARFLLRHPDGQNLGRKFKISLSGDMGPRFNLAAVHDLGLTAVRRGDGDRGFVVEVGGGLGAVPHEARRLTDFLPEAELLPTALAVLRLFARHGEKQKRARARLKFLVADWGIERFAAAVWAERALLPDEEVWRAHLGDDDTWADRPLHPPSAAFPSVPGDPDAQRWLQDNVFPQRQQGYAAVKVRVPQGDLRPEQLRQLAALLRAHTGDTLRIGWDQSLYLRHVPLDRLLAVREGLLAAGLGAAGAGGLGDTVTCPGADTCKLGITSPRAAARQMQAALDGLSAAAPQVADLRLHISGCPNACAQHQIADIGFFGAVRTREGVPAPHYMLLLGGRADGRSPQPGQEGAGFGTTILKIPAARLGEAVERLAWTYVTEAAPGESFRDFSVRLGRVRAKGLLQDLTDLPSPHAAPLLYREHGKADQPFAVVRGTGECAGAVVLRADLLLVDADRAADEAVARLEEGAAPADIQASALAAMHTAARALLDAEGLSAPPDPVAAFRETFYDTGRFFEGVGHHYLRAAQEGPADLQGDRLRRLVVEAGLFVEEVHAALGRLRNPTPTEAGAR